MEVVTPNPNGSPSIDPFDFNRARILPYLSAPSSPKCFGEYYYLSTLASTPKEKKEGQERFFIGLELESHTLTLSLQSVSPQVGQGKSHLFREVGPPQEEVIDIEWFFLISMTQSFANGGRLPGHPCEKAH
ncbi:Transcription factor AtMYC2 [Spatholobus suberectus]|nr:Transcription factor AtMYC2 [Spatholobus suberectus]